MTDAPIIVVGGGAIGSAIALRLAGDGLNVSLVEAGVQFGLAASSAALGGIILETDETCLGPLGSVTARSRHLLPDWLNTIREISGHSISVFPGGDVQVAMTEAELERLTTGILPRLRDQGLPAIPLTREELRELEPLLSRDVAGGVLFPDEIALEPAALMSAVADALEAHPRVHVRLGTRVTEIHTTASQARVVLSDGQSLNCEQVILAGGHLSRSLVPAIKAVTFPVKGQAVDIKVPDVSGYPLRHHFFAEIENLHNTVAYVVPREDGRLAVGVTYEAGVADDTPTAWGRESVLNGLRHLMPGAAEWPLVRHWAGVRPGVVDGVPLIGVVDDHDRLIVATGHQGLGITLAPVTAELVTVLVTGETPDPSAARHLDICDPHRFADSTVHT